MIIVSQVNLSYLNANNLYGWAMSQYLPYSGFKCLSLKKVDRFGVNYWFVKIIRMNTY